MASIRFQHRQFSGTEEHIEAMNWVKNTIAKQEFPGVAFAMSPTYSRWEVDEVGQLLCL